MTLTVRLDDALQTALEQHCARHGVTKTLVVQECLAQYLVAAQPGAAVARAVDDSVPPPSAAFVAFADAGLIGVVAGGNTQADKAAVRQQALRRLGRRDDAA